MSEQINDGQAKPAEQPAAKPGFNELFAKGWEQIDADEAATASKPAEKPPASEPECPDCPGGKPFKVIKHNGKDVIIKTEKEFNDLAQMGFDYTKKTQALAEERKNIQAEKTEHQKLIERLERLEKGSVPREVGDNGKPKPADKIAETTPQEDEAKVYADYGLDPEYASDFEKRLVRDVAATKRESQASRELSQMIILKEITGNIQRALADAAQEFPVDDIVDEKGESLTGRQVISTFREIVADPANQKTPVGELAKMAMKRVHDSQQAVKGKATPVNEEMTVEEFARLQPKLYAKILKAGGVEAVADFIENQEDLPPSITPRKGSVPATAGETARGKTKFKGLYDALDAGMDAVDFSDIYKSPGG